VKVLGDGFLATFDRPARAVRCAASIVEAVRALGFDVKAGTHAGEIEVKREDIAGIAVHIAARIAAIAQGGQVLVSRTVRDLVAGSNLRLADQGARAFDRFASRQSHPSRTHHVSAISPLVVIQAATAGTL
jgi:class 3 adenylate cyclase